MVLPAGDEEDDCPGAGTTRAKSTATAEALADSHDENLANQEEEEGTNSKPGSYVCVVLTVAGVVLSLLDNRCLCCITTPSDQFQSKSLFVLILFELQTRKGIDLYRKTNRHSIDRQSMKY